MRLSALLVGVLIVLLSGCATGPRKQGTQSRTEAYEKTQISYQKDSYSQDHGYDDAWKPDSYDKPVKEVFSGSTAQLSPKQIQRALKNAGYYDGPIDGKIGPKTKAAIIKFQKANGLKADGIVGKRTSAELNRYLSR